jgi:hypothetical protein
MAATMLSNQPAVVLSAALVLAAFLLWAFREIRTNPNIDQQIKANAKALFFVIAFVGFRAASVVGWLGT